MISSPFFDKLIIWGGVYSGEVFISGRCLFCHIYTHAETCIKCARTESHKFEISDTKYTVMFMHLIDVPVQIPGVEELSKPLQLR